MFAGVASVTGSRPAAVRPLAPSQRVPSPRATSPACGPPFFLPCAPISCVRSEKSTLSPCVCWGGFGNGQHACRGPSSCSFTARPFSSSNESGLAGGAADSGGVASVGNCGVFLVDSTMCTRAARGTPQICVAPPFYWRAIGVLVPSSTPTTAQSTLKIPVEQPVAYSPLKPSLFMAMRGPSARPQ